MKKYLVTVCVFLIIAIGDLLFWRFSVVSIPDVKLIHRETSDSCSWGLNEKALLNSINEARIRNGLSSVSLSENLDNFSQARANEMNELTFSHDNFIPLAQKIGLQYNYLGENLAENICAPKTLVSKWLNSSTHKKVMLNSKYKYIGIGYHDGVVVTEYGDLK